MNPAMIGLRAGLFRGAGAEAIIYVPAATGEPLPAVMAVRSFEPAGDTAGSGNVRQRTQFEVQAGDLPARPAKNDKIIAHDATWYVQEVPQRPVLGAWPCRVELAAK